MPPYRANTGGMFGSGEQPRPGGNIDIGSAIREVGNQASSLIQGAYLRRLAMQQQAAQKQQADMLRQEKAEALRIAAEERAARRAYEQERLGIDRERLRIQAQPKPEAPRVVDGQQLTPGPDGKLTASRIPGYVAPSSTQGKGAYEERNEGGGTAIYEGGRFARWKIPPPQTNPTRAQLPTEGERKAAAFYRSGKQGYDTLEALLVKGKGVPGFMAQQAARLGRGTGNLLTNEEVRQMRQAALQLSDAWLRYTSGAAVPETEVERFAESFIPRAGDDTTTLKQKKDARAVIIDALKQGAGRGLNPASVGTQPSAEEQNQRNRFNLPFDPDGDE